MKIPTQLVELGIGLELDCDTWEWTWNISDKMRLFSNPRGDQLVLLFSPKLGAPLKHPRNEKKQNFTKAKGLYGRFNGFEYDSINAHSVADSKLKRIGTANHIGYRSDKFSGKQSNYLHEFDCNPTVWTDHDLPHVIVISSIKLRVTRRGIEG